MKLAYIAIVTLAAIAVGAHDVTVNVLVQYPASNLNNGATLGLRGSSPLSWTESWPLTQSQTEPHNWRAQFTITGLNSTFKTWEVATKVIVDGNIWQLGCNDRFTVTINQTVLNVTMWPYFMTYNGTQVTLKNVHSPQLNNSRHVWLYIPPAMVENTYRWERNVNIFQDGQNLAPLWNVPEHLDKHILDGTMESLFVIGPYNMDAFRIDEYTYVPDPTYGGGDGNLYLDFLQDTLIPYVAARYQIMTAQENMGILGSSLGGLIACYAGITRRHIYSKIGCMSSSFWWDFENFRHEIVPQLTVEHARTQKYYIDSGDSGDTDDGRPESSRVMTQFPIRVNEFIIGTNLFYYLQRGGHHNEYFWSKRFRHPMQWLYFHDAVWNYHEEE